MTHGSLNSSTIWPIFLKHFESKHLTSQTLYILLFHISTILLVSENDEVEKSIYPFFVKCLACNHLKIQKLAFARLGLIIDRIKNEDNKKQLLVRLVGMIKTSKSELLLLNLSFINANFDKLDQEILKKQMVTELNEFLKSGREEGSRVSDLVFHLIQKTYKLEEPENEVS